ncbi:MAG: hypothetical protein IJ036_04885 [Lachnospiraceae bacterium]|nr:hypothetical protein [Lachnospiraceae bacterium]
MTKTSLWHKLLLWVSLGLLIFLNGYTMIHAVTGWMTVAGALLLFLLLFFAWKFLANASDPALKRITWILWGGIVLLQVAFVLLMHNNIRYDGYWVLGQAIEMLDTHAISPTLFNDYFTQVPNNYGLTLITYWYLSLVKALGCPADRYMTAVQLLNIVYIDLALLFVFLSVKKIKDQKSAVFFLLLCFISPFTYVWTPYYYTATTSMTFACAAVYLWLCIRETDSKKKSCILAGIMGILCITGFKVRATALIAFIAIFLFWTMAPKKATLKKYAPAILTFCLTAVVSFVGWKGIVNHYVPFDTTDTALPVTHFMMMGSQWDGSFNHADLQYTISLPTAQDKLDGTISVIKERLSENGLAGNIQLLLDKQLNSWVDGTDFFTYEHSLCTDFNGLHPFIVGSKTGYLTEYSQMLRVLQLFLVCVSCFFAFRRKKADGVFLIALNLLGGMAFQLLWETAPTYSIPFTFFAYALVCDGTEQLAGTRLFSRKGTAYACLGASAALLAVTCGALVFQKDTYLAEEHLQDDFVVNQHMGTYGETGPDMEAGETWCQTFETEDSFNVVNLYFINSGVETNTSVYRIALSDENGNVFYDDLLYGNSTGYELSCEIYTDLIVPQGRTRYTLEIEALEQDESNYLLFSCQDSSLIDLYPHGSLTVDGEETDHDLSFRVLNRRLTPYATKKEYSLFAILLISIELFLILCSLRFVKASGFINQERRTVS